MEGLTHFDHNGNAIMVDVSAKEITQRTAIARGYVEVSEEIFNAVASGQIGKGDVLGVARVAGIMAAKKTWDLIPMCHPLMLSACKVDFELKDNKIYIEALVKTKGETGVEMEALTAVSVAALTIYDMCKALSKDMIIGQINLVQKTGGKSGVYHKETL